MKAKRREVLTVALFCTFLGAVALGYLLISVTVGLRLHLSKEPREHIQVLFAGKEVSH